MKKNFTLVFLSLVFMSNSCQGPISQEQVKEFTKDSSSSTQDANSSEPNSTDIPNERVNHSDEMLCLKIKEEWGIFVQKEQIHTCKPGDGCVLFGSYGDCECSYGIVGGSAQGFAVNRKYLNLSH